MTPTAKGTRTTTLSASAWVTLTPPWRRPASTCGPWAIPWPAGCRDAQGQRQLLTFPADFGWTMPGAVVPPPDEEQVVPFAVGRIGVSAAVDAARERRHGIYVMADGQVFNVPGSIRPRMACAVSCCVCIASYEDPVVMPTCVGACRQPSGKRVTRSA